MLPRSTTSANHSGRTFAPGAALERPAVFRIGGVDVYTVANAFSASTGDEGVGQIVGRRLG